MVGLLSQRHSAVMVGSRWNRRREGLLSLMQRMWGTTFGADSTQCPSESAMYGHRTYNCALTA